MTHIAGHAVVVEGRYQRQLCAWCGLPLIDNDLSRMASVDGSPPGTWELGSLIEVDGNMSTKLLEAALPDDACCVLEITR